MRWLLLAVLLTGCADEPETLVRRVWCESISDAQCQTLDSCGLEDYTACYAAHYDLCCRADASDPDGVGAFRCASDRHLANVTPAEAECYRAESLAVTCDQANPWPDLQVICQP